MRVLFVYSYLTLGGVEAVLRARLDGLAAHGIEAHAWFFHDFGGRSIFSGLEDRVRVGDAAACLVFARDFDLVSTIDTAEVLAGYEAPALPLLPPLIVECHSAYLDNIEYLRRLPRLRPAAVFTPSPHHARLVAERVGEGVDVRVVPNPVRRELAAEPAPFPAPPRRPVLAWVGRLDEHKNWKGFVEIAGTLAQRGVVAEAWIAGRPVEPERSAELLARAREAGILHRLRWFRGLPHERIPAFFDAVRDSGGVAVTTSRGESFGMTVVEAMARRCAVLVPDSGPFTDFVADGVSGGLYRPGSTQSAAGRLQTLLGDARLREACGRRAREVVLARFAPGPALAVLAAELTRAAAAR
ncbi:MAG TPA: glycosyltransferase family 4 protein [Thermoanaerobaculia bacterium]|jgi:glycosyltransferase involved in cell wall biosynthesis|nr:glycosyltransferase family 4 protein [Thermoanaerobaculia bacterium]